MKKQKMYWKVESLAFENGKKYWRLRDVFKTEERAIAWIRSRVEMGYYYGDYRISQIELVY